MIRQRSHAYLLCVHWPTPRCSTMEEMTSAQQQPLYDAVGGASTFRIGVACFNQLVATDATLRPLYPQDDRADADQRLRMFLEQYRGGPQTSSERPGHRRPQMWHLPFQIGPTQRDAGLRCMQTAVGEIDAETLGDEHRREPLDYLRMVAHSPGNTPF